MRRTRWLAAGALVVTAAAIFAFTVDRSHPSDSTISRPRATDAQAVTAITSDTRHRFERVEPLVGASDLVVRGRVVAAEAGRVFGSGSSAIRSHVLTLRVDKVLAGAASACAGAVVLVEEEAELADGTAIEVDGMRASRIGDDGIWFLVASRDPDFPGYAVVNSQGRYLRNGDTLRGGDRSDALVAALAALGERGLADAVVAAR